MPVSIGSTRCTGAGPAPFFACVRCASAVLFVIGGSLAPVVGTVCLGRRDSHADPGAVATQFSSSTETGTSPCTESVCFRLPRHRTHRQTSGVVYLPKRLRDLGYVESQNLVIERRYAEGKPDRLPAFARKLVEVRVDVIVAVGNSAIRAARDATQTIPIVMAFGLDPVGQGFVKSLASPGGNITGVSYWVERGSEAN